MSETFTIDGHPVELSRPDKVLFPAASLAKRDLFEYHRRIWPTMAPHIHGRPVSVQRFPDGVDASGFFQKNVPDHYPAWIARAKLPAEDQSVTYLLVDTEATLAHLANQACVTLHVGSSRVDALERPDRLIFDLDPSGDEDDEHVRQGALMLREHLEGTGFRPFVMSTGSRGLHVVCPLEPEFPFDAVRSRARDIARKVADLDPDNFTTEVRKDARKGRVFIDYLRNAYGQTAVAPYTVRARGDAPIATPLDWIEVEASDWTPRKTTMANIFRRLGQKADPWGDIDAARTALK